MSITRPLLHKGLKLLFAIWRAGVTSEVAAKTEVCTVGGLYLQARGIHNTKDIDIVVRSHPDVDRFKIHNMIAAADSHFTVSTKGKCCLTYCENPQDEVVCFDIIDDEVTLDEVVDKDKIPLPMDSEFIAMKLFAADDCLDSRFAKAVNDVDDAMKIANKLDKQGGVTTYKDNMEKEMVQAVFNSFYPKYKAFKEEKGEFYWTKEEWKAYLSFD
ncbi:hypothetical protein JOM56_006655 [Amanita muscaria]